MCLSLVWMGLNPLAVRTFCHCICAERVTLKEKKKFIYNTANCQTALWQEFNVSTITILFFLKMEVPFKNKTEKYYIMF